VFASGDTITDVAGTRGKAFEENESNREPSKSISPKLEVAGAAGKKHIDVISTNKQSLVNVTCKDTSYKALIQDFQNDWK